LFKIVNKLIWLIFDQSLTMIDEGWIHLDLLLYQVQISCQIVDISSRFILHGYGKHGILIYSSQQYFYAIGRV